MAHTTTAARLAAAGLGVAPVPTSAPPIGLAEAEHEVRPLDPPLSREVVVLLAAVSDPLVARSCGSWSGAPPLTCDGRPRR